MCKRKKNKTISVTAVQCPQRFFFFLSLFFRFPVFRAPEMERGTKAACFASTSPAASLRYVPRGAPRPGHGRSGAPGQRSVARLKNPQREKSTSPANYCLDCGRVFPIFFFFSADEKRIRSFFPPGLASATHTPAPTTTWRFDVFFSVPIPGTPLFRQPARKKGERVRRKKREKISCITDIYGAEGDRGRGATRAGS